MTVDEAKTKECLHRIWNCDGDGFVKCSADSCMAWTWLHPKRDKEGYCGLIKKGARE